MNNISDFYSQAELALAAYANLTTGISGTAYTKALTDAGMADAQAADFASKWLVIVTPYTDLITGVSATVFQEIATGQKTLAIRGTQGATDYLADYFILNGTPSQLNPQYLSLKTKVQAWLKDGTLTPGFTVSGHSLGGYLAAGLVADFSTSISHAYLYNAPGNNSLVSQVMQALGIVATPDATKITSLRADAGISPVAGLGSNFSLPIHIHIENQFDLGLILSAPGAMNHSQQVLTDSLAIYNLFATLDPNISSTAITDILKAASNKAPDTLETALANVGKIFNKTYPAAATDRDTLYTNLYELQGILKGTSAGLLTVTSLASKTSSDLVNAAQSDIAYRYALKELNPFALTGDDGLYAQFNAHNELDLYDPDTGKGALSEQWLKDRAVFAVDKAIANTADKTTLTGSENWTLTDNKTNTTLNLANGNWTLPHKLTFADDTGQTLAGGYVEDHLYGGTGNDTLSGEGGNDTLEGGKGTDNLDGGSGDDQLWGGEGADTLKGGDDNDKLYGGIGEDTIEGGAGADLIYGDLLDPDNTVVAYKDTLDGGEGNDRIYGGGGDDTIKGSEGGDYLYGDAGKDTVVGGDGQDYIEGGSEDDTLYGDGENEDDTSFKGNDQLFGGKGKDKLYGGDGNDIIDGGAGADIMKGGDGADTLTGGEGNDQMTGGKGDDTMDGGAGYDNYLIEGSDTIQDADGQGTLRDKAGNLITGAIEKREDGSYVYLSDPSISVTKDADLTLTLADGTVAIIKNYQDGDLGLQLVDKPADPQTTLTINGDVKPTDTKPDKDGNQADGTAQNNPIGTSEPYEDTLSGSAGNDHILSGDLNDDIGGGAGDDWIEGGSGNDYIGGGSGNDLIEGGAGSDTLIGEDGTIYAGAGDDMANGERGDDTLYMEAGNDQVFGGARDDAEWRIAA